MERFLQKIDWLTQISWTDGLIALLIISVFFLSAYIFSKYMPKLLSHITKKSQIAIDQALLASFRKPIVLILLATGLFLAFSYLPIPASGMSLITRFYHSLATVSIGWGFYLFSNTINIFFAHVHDRYDLQFNTIIIPFLSKIAKFVVVIFTAVAILDQWNYHVTGLITGLGIGGLAIAMAAKDTLSNFFGGLVIITDAPFTIGELIQSGTIEGIVEDINFRSTRIRTADQALVTVPNSTLANQPITNMSRLGKRRVLIHTPLEINTSSQQLQNCLSRIRQLLSVNDAIYEDGQMVWLDKISSASLDLSIQFFTKTVDFNEWTLIKENFNLAILQILYEEHVELASTRLTQAPADEKTPIKKSQPLVQKPPSAVDDPIEKAMRSRSSNN
ncbi:mechanosensitive ion channel family protein [Sporolactobacillus spathodeae]|uniref:MscS family membrane protein n=1 Tax=Sporolactobacillus spathodeae TaxID=1465502 RepID=A0ABS2Q7X9_9BACL|nr:mechanosensitive ion channel family protein [Sporolactobacillus spathodeae]MBM7657891.1 MscS family membrane protein [Sporolactobacillus spathodeae]